MPATSPAVTIESRRAVHPAITAAIFAAVVLAVFLTRYVLRGDLYYVDGPRLMAAIHNHTYVIQSPGYWLYARTASLFPHPVWALQFMNELFSAVGSGVFLLVCVELGISLGVSLLAVAAFASVFFVWFSGEIHSAYAAEALFPLLTAWLFMRYVRSRKPGLLLGATVSFAVATGMRPSDGVFLLPLFAYALLRYVENWPRRLFSAGLYGVLCLGWYIPTRLNATQADQAVSGQLGPLVHITSILFGAPLAHVAANMLRVLLPSAVAFWMLLPAWLTQRQRELLLIVILWVIPGYMFFLLVHMADAPYLTYMTAPLILLAAMAGNRKLAVASLALCLLWNSGFFLIMRPVRSHAMAAEAIDYYTIKYTRYGIDHHWTSTVHEGAAVIP